MSSEGSDSVTSRDQRGAVDCTMVRGKADAVVGSRARGPSRGTPGLAASESPCCPRRRWSCSHGISYSNNARENWFTSDGVVRLTSLSPLTYHLIATVVREIDA